MHKNWALFSANKEMLPSGAEKAWLENETLHILLQIKQMGKMYKNWALFSANKEILPGGAEKAWLENETRHIILLLQINQIGGIKHWET